MLAARVRRALKGSMPAPAARCFSSVITRWQQASSSRVPDLAAQKPLAFSLFRHINRAIDEAARYSNNKLSDTDKEAIKLEAERAWYKKQALLRVGPEASDAAYNAAWKAVRTDLNDETNPELERVRLAAKGTQVPQPFSIRKMNVGRFRKVMTISPKLSPAEREQKKRNQMKEQALEQLRREDAQQKALAKANERKRREPISPMFLRDCCCCPLCIDPSSNQRLFRTTDIPADITGTPTITPSGDEVEIRWDKDIPGFPADHVTRLPWPKISDPDTIRQLVMNELAKRNFWEKPVVWDRAKLEQKDDKWVEYDDWINSDEAFYKSLKNLATWGILFVRNVPDSESSVERIANRIGCLKETLYGRTWDVKSKPSASNIAYTSHNLGLHQDLMYVKQPPRLQFLHSLRARAPGGESRFSDAFKAVADLWETNHSTVYRLSNLAGSPNKIPFWYNNDGHSYRSMRHTIELSGRGTDVAGRLTINRVNYSPPFQAQTHQLRRMGAGRYYESIMRHLRIFGEEVEKEKNVFELKLQEGECVIFDNQRVLHARREFDANAGERWLKGAYVDGDVWNSAIVTCLARNEDLPKELLDAEFPDMEFEKLEKSLRRSEPLSMEAGDEEKADGNEEKADGNEGGEEREHGEEAELEEPDNGFDEQFLTDLFNDTGSVKI